MPEDERPAVDVEPTDSPAYTQRGFRIGALVMLYGLPPEVATAMDTALVELTWQLHKPGSRARAVELPPDVDLNQKGHTDGLA